MKRAIRFLPIILILSVFSVWMLAAGATSRASIDAEFATAEELVANGDGVQITVESTGSEVFRGGRRAFPKTCYTFEYTASGVRGEAAVCPALAAAGDRRTRL